MTNKNLLNAASYYVPAQEWRVELEVKRSKFLTFVNLAENRQVADDFIRSLREQYPQASHVCWAYIAGSPNTTIRSMSDDGEPSGTAGMPMLKVLEYSGLGDIVVAVVRFFGGTKLGTGGLQRAYSDAVALGLENLPTQIKVSRSILSLDYDYEHQGDVQRLLKRFDVENLTLDYAVKVSCQLAVAVGERDALVVELTNITAGKINIVLDDS